jgi:hypothetical protein
MQKAPIDPTSEYRQYRRKELEELLKRERELRHTVEKQIAVQGGEDFAPAGLLSNYRDHQKRIEELKVKLNALDNEEEFTDPPAPERFQARLQSGEKNRDVFVGIQMGDDIEPTSATPRPSRKKWLLPVAALVIFLSIDLLLWQSNLFAAASQQDIAIDSNYHHLGDNIYNEEYMQSVAGDRIRNLTPEGLKYVNSFSIASVNGSASSLDSIKQAQISITLNQLKPRRSSAVILFVNGNLVAYLNDYVQVEQFKRQSVLIPLDPQYLVEGNNEVLIQVEQDQQEGDYEDMEFNNLRISLEWSSGKASPLTFTIIAGIEIIALVTLILAAMRKQ